MNGDTITFIRWGRAENIPAMTQSQREGRQYKEMKSYQCHSGNADFKTVVKVDGEQWRIHQQEQQLYTGNVLG